jgi:hypothetical protein
MTMRWLRRNRRKVKDSFRVGEIWQPVREAIGVIDPARSSA